LSSINIRTFLTSFEENLQGSIRSSVGPAIVPVPLLNEVNINLNLTRLLEQKYNDFFPQFAVKTHISSIDLQLSEMQLILILSVLNGNLKEGVIEAPPAENKEADVQVESTKGRKRITITENTQDNTASMREKRKTSTIASTIRRQEVPYLADVEMVLDKITFEIVPGIGAVTPGSARPSVASFNIDQVRLDAKVKTDNEMKAHFHMHRMTLSDTRIDCHNQFRGLVDSSTLANTRHLMSLRYEKSNTGDQNVRLDLNSPTVYVVPDALFGIQEFFMNALAMAAPPPGTENKPVVESKTSNNTASVQDPDKVPQPEAMTFAVVNLNNIELVLLHKARKINTRAMVLKTSLSLTFSANVDELAEKKSDDGNEEHELTISEYPCEKAVINISTMQAFVCRPGLDNEDRSSILRPLNISLNYNNNPDVTRVNMNIEPTNLVLTYQDFKLVTGILEEVQKHQPVKETPPVTPETPVAATTTAVTKVTKPKQESLQFKCTSLYITLVNDFEGRNIPLISLAVAEVLVTVGNWSSNMDAFVDFRMFVDYFNPLVVKYEPLIEDYSVRIKAQKRQEPQMCIEIRSDDIFNMNISHALIDNLGTLKSILDRDYLLDAADKESVKVNNNSRNFSPYWIVNKTGSKINIIADGINKINKEVVSGEEYPIGYATNDRNTSTGSSTRTISLQIEDTLVPEFSLDRVGTQEFSVSKGNLTTSVICRIVLDEGSKIVTLQSLASVTNKSSVSILVGFFDTGNGTNPTKVLGPILPEENIPIPIIYVEKGLMVCKPEDDSSWNTGINIFDMRGLSTLRTDENNNTKSSKTKTIFECSEGRELVLYAKVSDANESDALATEVELLINAPVVVENVLPVTLNFRLNEGTTTSQLESGKTLSIYNVSTSKTIKMSVQAENWQESRAIVVHAPDKKSTDVDKRFKMVDKNGPLEINMSIESRLEAGSRKLVIFVPYWILNHSGMDMKLRQRVL